jgi:hypothetical protein
MIGHRAPLIGEFEVVVMIAIVIERWMCRTEFLTRTITSEPEVGLAISTRAKWRSCLSAGQSVLRNLLDTADIVREAMLRQQSL